MCVYVCVYVHTRHHAQLVCVCVCREHQLADIDTHFSVFFCVYIYFKKYVSIYFYQNI